jgi:hypothetical protein
LIQRRLTEGLSADQRQAAKATGKSKSSISRAIETGRLSANRNGGRFEIDAAELHRVFPLKVEGGQAKGRGAAQPVSTKSR